MSTRVIYKRFNWFHITHRTPLTRCEIMDLSQIVTSHTIKHAPNVFAFTEQGMAMLSGVLNSERAILVNIAVMRAFVKLREIIASHKELAEKLHALEKKYDRQFRIVFDAIRELMTPPAKTRHKIGFGMIEEK